MSNDLIKNVVTHYTPGFAGVPGTPYVPGRTIVTYKRVCNFVDIGHGLRIWYCQQVPVATYIPPQPARPALPGPGPAVEIDYQLGWNAGARSVHFIRGDGYAEFQVRASVVGVICGLNVADVVNAKYISSNIDFAFSCSRGVARIVQNGQFVASVGTYTDDSVFRIEHTGTDIIYKKDGAVLHTTPGVSTPDLFLEASLYAGGDSVFNPKLVQTAADDLTPTSGTIDLTLPPLDVLGSDGAHAEINITLPALDVDMQAGLPQPGFALIGIALPPLDVFATLLSGTSGQIDIELPALDVLAADHAYGFMDITLPALDVEGWAIEGNTQASMYDDVQLATSIEAPSHIAVVFNSMLGIEDAWGDTNGFSVEMFDGIALAATFDINAIMSAVMQTGIGLGWLVRTDGSGSAGATDDGSETWTVNLESHGSTRYDNYRFNSFAKIRDRYYGAREDGLYLLEGDTDAGELIRSVIGFGKLDFSKTEKVTVQQCYVGMSGKGNLFLKVIANGQAYIYKTRNFTDVLQQQRITTGKGLRTNYVELELYNEEGADFEIDTVKFIVADMTRKI